MHIFCKHHSKFAVFRSEIYICIKQVIAKYQRHNMERQEDQSPNMVGRKRAGNSGDKPSFSRKVVPSRDTRRPETFGASDNCDLHVPTNVQVKHSSQLEDDFTVKKIGSFIIITHVQSRTRTKVSCTGAFECDENMLSCNNECFELKFENGRIILEAIPEYSEKDDVTTKAAPVRDQTTGPPTQPASTYPSTDPKTTTPLHCSQTSIWSRFFRWRMFGLF